MAPSRLFFMKVKDIGHLATNLDTDEDGLLIRDQEPDDVVVVRTKQGWKAVGKESKRFAVQCLSYSFDSPIDTSFLNPTLDLVFVIPMNCPQLVGVFACKDGSKYVDSWYENGCMEGKCSNA